MNDVLVTSRYGPWRQVWIVGGIGALSFLASAKLLLVDRALDIALYPALGGVAFAIVAGLLWTQSGTFRITRTAIHARKRVGPAVDIPLSGVRSVETGTNKLPRLVIVHAGGTTRLDAIGARRESIEALRSLGVRVS